jgi:hypothetical protein
LQQIRIIVYKVKIREGFHDIVVLLKGDFLKMLFLNEESGEETIFFLAHLELVVLFVVKLEVDHLVKLIGVILSQKILTPEKICVVLEFRIGKFGLTEIVSTLL